MSEKETIKKKVLSQKKYLKKYLSGEKKKKEKIKIQKRVHIIDDNIDCVNDDDDNINNCNNITGFDPVDEFAPQIVAVIDERPQDIKVLDMYKNKNRWKRIGDESDHEDDSTAIDVDQVKNYVHQINKSTLNDLIKKKDKVSMENNIPIKRDRKTGKKRDLNIEREEQQKKEEIIKEHKEKHAIWGRGVKQVKDAQEKYQSDLHEMLKPLARYADDQDFENLLKSQIREGDPMLKYISSNKKTKDESPDGVRHEIREFRGFCPPNRFGIRPGHKWDGVDRSNGYEAKWLLQVNSQKALEDEAYKWSCSDI